MECGQKKPCQKVSRVNVNLAKHDQWPPNEFTFHLIKEWQFVLPPTHLLAGPVPCPQGFKRDQTAPPSPLK